MKKIISLFTTFSTDEDGASMVEYSILIGLISALLVVLVLWVGNWANEAWATLADALFAGNSFNGAVSNPVPAP